MYDGKLSWLLVAGTLSVVAPVGAIDTATICQTLGAAAGFGVVASKGFQTTVVKGVTPPPDGWGVTVHGSVCAPQVSVARTVVVADGASPGDVVGTNAKGVGVKLARVSQVSTSPTHNAFAGSIVTGGGAVQTYPTEPPADAAGIDVTGTNPLVAACTQAPLDLEAASDAFAALPPNQTYDTLFLALGTTYTLTVAAGDVVNINYVQLQGPKYTKGMDCAATPGAHFDIVGEGPAVINVLMIHPGVCGALTAETTGGPIIINYKGPGKTPVFHAGEDFVGILAPLRTVQVSGTGDGGVVHLGYAFGRKIKASGQVQMGGAICP